MRLISTTEQIYLACEKLFPPFCISLVVELESPLNFEELQKAVGEVSRLHPPSRWQKHNRLFRKTWIERELSVRVKVLSSKDSEELRESEEFKELKESEDNWTKQNLDSVLRSGCEVLIDSKCQKIIFRCRHSLMDAVGLLKWAQDIFRSLNGQIPLGGQKTDSDQSVLRTSPWHYERQRLDLKSPGLFAQKISQQNRNGDETQAQTNSKTPAEKSSPSKTHAFYHTQRTLIGQRPSVVAQLAALLAEQIRKHSKAPIRFMIPVDLRQALKTQQTSVNFSNPLFVTLTGPVSWQRVQEEILGQLRGKKQFGTFWWENWVGMVPQNLLSHTLQKLHALQTGRNRFIVSSVISNVGRIFLESLSAPGSRARRAYFLPVDTPGAGSTFLILEHDHGIEVSGSFPESNCAIKEVEAWMDQLPSRIQGAH